MKSTVHSSAGRAAGTRSVVVRSMACEDYVPLWHAMQRFTDERGENTSDELWFTEHPPVFTQGLNGKAEHVLAPGDIPVVQVDRGGQVTYHGPGQLMVYPLLDLKRARIGVRELVTALEQSVVDLLAGFEIDAIARKDAPGVYVTGRKVASVGLRVRRGASLHGMAVNIDLDLEPFSRINTCGYSDLDVTSLRNLGISGDRHDIQTLLQHYLLKRLEMQPQAAPD